MNKKKNLDLKIKETDLLKINKTAIKNLGK